MRPDPERPLRRVDALEAGHTDFELRVLYTEGGWRQLGYGSYVDAGRYAMLSDVAQHTLAIDAVLPSLDDAVAVSHHSAAVLHGLPLTGVDLKKVHVTRDRCGGGRTGSRTVVHCAPLEEVDVMDGRRVTTLARTVVDMGRTASLDTAVAAGDAAVRDSVTASALALELDRARRRKGVASARQAVELLDGRSESVGESLSRLRLLKAGFREVEPQVKILDTNFRFLARVDFLVAQRVVVEFDGEIKYDTLLEPGQEREDVLLEQQVREDRVRALGYPFVRFGWDDLWNFDPVVKKIEEALASADKLPPPLGRVIFMPPLCP
jgi:very-short-patch-repair endonuclease